MFTSSALPSAPSLSRRTTYEERARLCDTRSCRWLGTSPGQVLLVWGNGAGRGLLRRETESSRSCRVSYISWHVPPCVKDAVQAKADPAC
eukprot:2751635-Pyramimonas_sp.AAC.1